MKHMIEKNLRSYLTGLMISLTLLFISCAHKDNVAEGEIEGTNEEDLALAEDLKEEKENAEEDIEAIEQKKEEDHAKAVEENTEEAEKKLEQELLALNNNNENTQAEQPTPLPEKPPVDSSQIETAMPTQTEAELKQEETAAQAPAAPEVKQTDTLSESFSTPPVPTPRIHRSSATPEIPSQPIERNGGYLNRFYFLRAHDTTQSVSELIYGNGAKAKDLKTWNPKASWTPGEIIYYNSPNQPSDSQMLSYYRENNIPSEAYVVENGDWLSKIAKKKYGHPGTWREIATINGLASPDSISTGQKLALYPMDLSSTHKSQQYVQNEEKTEHPVSEEKQAPSEQAQELAPEASAPPTEITPKPTEQAPVTETKPVDIAPVASEPSNDLIEKIQKNLFTLAIGGVVILLLAGLFILNRKRKSQTDDFSDENYDTKKANRK